MVDCVYVSDSGFDLLANQLFLFPPHCTFPGCWSGSTFKRTPLVLLMCTWKRTIKTHLRYINGPYSGHYKGVLLTEKEVHLSSVYCFVIVYSLINFFVHKGRFVLLSPVISISHMHVQRVLSTWVPYSLSFCHCGTIKSTTFGHAMCVFLARKCACSVHTFKALLKRLKVYYNPHFQEKHAL